MSELRIFLRLFLYIFVPLVAVFLTYSLIQKAVFDPADASDSREVYVEIGPNLSFDEAARLIAEKGVVKYPQSLKLIARLRGLKTDIKPGEYILAKSMTPIDVLKALDSERVYKRSFVLSAGMSIHDIGAIVEEAGLIEKSELDQALHQANLLAKAGISAESFEGYLLPGTYSLSRPVSAQQIIWTMLEAAEKTWVPEFSAKANELQLSRHEILTLASIIQKETNYLREEGAKLSSVMHNRLTQGMKLRSEATVAYGANISGRILTPEDLEVPGPYNTFINFGLPQAPICNPSLEAIEAALFPEETTYLFYFKGPTGHHVFSSTQKEHNEAMSRVLAIPE